MWGIVLAVATTLLVVGGVGGSIIATIDDASGLPGTYVQIWVAAAGIGILGILISLPVWLGTRSAT